MDASPVAVEGHSAVVRLEVRYGDPGPPRVPRPLAAALRPRRSHRRLRGVRPYWPRQDRLGKGARPGRHGDQLDGRGRGRVVRDLRIGAPIALDERELSVRFEDAPPDVAARRRCPGSWRSRAASRLSPARREGYSRRTRPSSTTRTGTPWPARRRLLRNDTIRRRGPAGRSCRPTRHRSIEGRVPLGSHPARRGRPG